MDYVESLSDVWSFILTKRRGQRPSLNDYKAMFQDIVRLIKELNTRYPIAMNDQYLINLLPSGGSEWARTYLNDHISSTREGDVKTMLQGLLTDLNGSGRLD